MSAYDFNRKVVWITGASSGIGLALAKALLDQKSFVVVTARNEEKLKNAFGNHKNVLIAPGDMTVLKKNFEVISLTKSRFGHLDCVILNAGNAEYLDISKFSHQPFTRMMDTNFLSITKGIEASLPLLRQSKNPYLVAMSSSVAWLGLPRAQAYSASKAAIRNLFQGLNIQLSAENIDVSWICPGFVETPLTDKNTFSMPFCISADKAADIIVGKLAKKRKEIFFPKRFTYLLKLISLMPASWHPSLLKGTLPQS